MRYRARPESCVNLDGPIAMLPCLHQGNIYTKRKTRVCRDKKCIPLVIAKTPLTCVVRQSTPSRGRQYKAPRGKFQKLVQIYHHGIGFAPRKYLYQKEANDMERPEMYSACRCKNHTSQCGPSKYSVSMNAV